MPVKIEKDNSLTISGFEGIGQSVLSDFADMMGVNTETPGVAGVNFKFQKVTNGMPDLTFTANVDTDVITLSASGRWRGTYNGMAFTVTTTGTLPTGLSADTIYYAAEINATTFKVCTTLKNIGDTTYVNITGAGTGTHTIHWITPKQIKGWTTNSQGRIFALDYDPVLDEQRVWFADSNGVGSEWLLLDGNTTAGTGNGIIYYKGYIIVFGTAGCDALTDIQSPYSTAITWTNGFDDINISTGDSAVPFLSVNDDSVYFYNGATTGRYYKLGMFEEVSGQTFNPTNASTFDFVEEVTVLPFENNGYITTINEINEYLILGTGSDKIYFWDKKSPAFTSFLRLQEKNVQSIQVVDNIAYIFMAESGNIYQANTSSSGLLLKIPEQITGQYYKYFTGTDEFRTNYSAIYKRELIFSVSILDTDLVYNYLMSYNIDNKILTKKNISSFGETSERSGNFYGRIHSIHPVGENILVSSSSYDISEDLYSYAVESLLYVADVNSGSETYYTYDGNEPYIITGLVGVGDVYNKKTFRELQISLSRALATGQGVTVSYRLDDNSSWTTLKSITYAVDGAIKDIKVPAPITDIIDLQIKINLDGLNLTSPLLKFVRLIP